MDRTIALAAFLLSLLGCEPQRSVFEHRVVDGGRDLLRARASLDAGVARFECLASASGLCYWALYPPHCADEAAGCDAAPTQRFALAADDARQLAGVGGMRLCVGDRAGSPATACHVLGASAH